MEPVSFQVQMLQTTRLRWELRVEGLLGLALLDEFAQVGEVVDPVI